MNDNLTLGLAEQSLSDALQASLDARKQAGQYRSLTSLTAIAPTPEHGPLLTNGQKQWLDFSGNDYLGLSWHPALRNAAAQALQDGAGTGSSRLITGTTPAHTLLEAELADFLQTPAALVFNSGYQANVSLLSALADRHDLIILDKLAHASLLDGAHLSRATVQRFAHNDIEQLEKRLADRPQGQKCLVVSESVFSMDGDLAPLADIFHLCERYNAWLIVDEAHATGVFGQSCHSGLWEETGLGHQSRVIQMGTFSKALGSFGAYVGASQTVIDFLINHARGLIYSTSLPPAVIAANRAALKVVQQVDQPYTQQLWQAINQFNALGDIQTQSPIVPIIVGESGQAFALSQHLSENGFRVQAIRPPTVPKGSARLRLTLNASHQPQEIENLMQLLQAQTAVLNTAR